MLTINPERSFVMRKLFLLSAVGALILTASPCWAEIPHRINYQGMLTDNGGMSVTDTLDITFRIYDQYSSGTKLWDETQSNVEVIDGLFSVTLGSVSTLDLPFDENYWLEIDVGPGEILTPRVQLTSVGYAYRAEMADTASYAIEAVSAETDGDWTVTGDDLYSAVAGSVGIGTSNPSARLDVRGALNQGAPGSGNTYNVNFYGYTTESRMLWDAWNIALRAGREEHNRWHNDSVGYCSFSAGYGTKASGDRSTALGMRSVAEGGASVAMGDNARATGDFSVAMGRIATASGDASIAMGRETTASGWTSAAMGYVSTAAGEVSTAIGFSARAIGDTSIAIGYRVTADALNAIVLGKGAGTSDRLVNNIPNSLMIGFNSTKPTLFVDGSSVGIGTTSPAGVLHIENSGSGEEAFLWIKSSHPTNWHEAGIRIETPENKWHFRMDDDANKQIPVGTLGLRSQDSEVETMTWAENGNVGIGTAGSSPTQKLDVNGTARLRVMSTGTGTDVVVDATGVLKKISSSLRYKKNIRELNINPQRFLQLEPVRFEWKTTGEEDIGLVAEDVEEVIPDLVIHDQEGRPDAVKYDKVAIYLLQVVKTLNAKNQELEKRIAELESTK